MSLREPMFLIIDPTGNPVGVLAVEDGRWIGRDTSGRQLFNRTDLTGAGHAAHRNQAVTATIAFGSTTTVLVPPRERPTQILQMATGGGTATFIDAVKLADQVLGLRRTRTLRLLAVVSDGHLDNIDPAQKLITTLHRTGCAVLWLRPAKLSGRTFDQTTTITIADPVDAIGHITDAALTALTNA